MFYYRGKNQAAKDIAGRYPISHFWDKTESKLLVCEAQIQPQEQSKDDTKDNNRNLLNKHTMSEEVSLSLNPIWINNKWDGFYLIAFSTYLLLLELRFVILEIKS